MVRVVFFLLDRRKQVTSCLSFSSYLPSHPPPLLSSFPSEINVRVGKPPCIRLIDTSLGVGLFGETKIVCVCLSLDGFIDSHSEIPQPSPGEEN